MTAKHDHRTVLTAFASLRLAEPTAVAINYYGNSISRAELDDLSERLAQAWANHVRQGDRVAVALQNTPLFAIALLATWKLEAVLVPVSPMLKSAELTALLADSGAQIMLAHPEMIEAIAAAVDQLEQPPALFWSSASDLAGDLDAPWSSTTEATPMPAQGAPVSEALNGQQGLARGTPSAQDGLALLTYTSGTTGPSKGAMLTHANIANQAFITPDCFGLKPGDTMLTLAPFFHITGLCMHLAIGLGNGLPMVMTYRFDAHHVSKLIEHYRPSFTVGTITAFIALAEHARASQEAQAALGAMTSSFSGGAAVPAAVIERYEKQFGVYIRNGYGLTESSSVCIAVPTGQRAPVDAGSGATSIGRPLPGVTVAVIADDGTEVPAGVPARSSFRDLRLAADIGTGPDETANTFRPDGLHTGDIGFIDQHGWIYVVDRKKDLIIVSGYKVWPRDVEDVLYQHASVAEAAVVGIPDSYRGESVAAFVVPRPGTSLDPDELNRHCRERLSAYKCPRRYEIVSALPKSASGKILRRLLRG